MRSRSLFPEPKCQDGATVALCKPKHSQCVLKEKEKKEVGGKTEKRALKMH